MPDKPDHQKAAEIVRDAGGTIVGRTRLQKVACLLQLAGFEDGFRFGYHHYGPYSEELTDAIRVAEAFDLVSAEDRRASWGGVYTVFTSTPASQADDRTRFAQAAAQIDSIELELAATAAYLAVVEKAPNPWEETARRKPDKVADGRLERAKTAYRQLHAMKTRKKLPKIA
ncbi:conserved hypothetical protein [uncultured Gammaproteobacteria bacterium]